MTLSQKCPSYGVSSRGAVVQVVLTQLGPTSVYLPSKAGPKALPACLPPPRPQQPVETNAPEEIPPEVVQEYVDIMEELLGPPAGAMGELEGQREEGKVEQEGDQMLLDPGVLSYVDNLCSQKDFVTKVGLA
ncbi:NUT member 2G [Saguinus oedipus]|uniref:NUT member 2G n=1 Tax=Saguinus oedipus TaxID=9490 RepID=A0ABQ9WBY8_SAGOE|nr:NUT member 2G [Saguinus oedipus]